MNAAAASLPPRWWRAASQNRKLRPLLSNEEWGVFAGLAGGLKKAQAPAALESAFRSGLAASGNAKSAGSTNKKSAGAIGKSFESIKTISHGKVTVDFDSDNYVSKSQVTGLQFVMPTEFLAPFFRRAEPQNWSSASEFFLRSNPVREEKEDWVKIDAPWLASGEGGNKDGLLYEIATAQINELVGSESHNILSISNFVNEFNRASTSAKVGEKLVFQYDYALEEALGSKLGVLWEPEGLDVDGGRYSATATRQKGDEWLVDVAVSKSLRYTLPENSPSELSSVLNTLAPALLTMFMKDLSLDTLNYVAALGASPPARTAPQAGLSKGTKPWHAKKTLQAPTSRASRTAPL